LFERFALKRFQLPLVDLCNAVSLAYTLPIAVIDLAKASPPERPTRPG
jgi:DNA/RNA-binding domain of Phe-tRNA-synthetase-like protein